ncbi:hypothetical protein BFP72_12365 [Reichenbachiella sp. 5M10]|uniref:translocation/assembly module TamB domain-containing protein n=1 Tax=Reichenbachiella sp. 5M10 TaxID=1889772 RepID=UPI000C14DD45|nr:translocation/assembly module TamB domain-containing protein [Reichenbachiella sp. 5M10]PIB36133.1 hypothetical protein BFP72_12365 [Reichenbachiella sp. 5M10]
MEKKSHVEGGILLHGIARIVVWIPVMIFSTFLVAFAFFQVPKIQTKFINSVIHQISSNTSFEIEVGHINLTWYDKMLVKDLRIYEKETDSTLIAAQEARINISLLDLILKRTLHAETLELTTPSVHLIKKGDSSMVNISQFVYELRTFLKKENQGAKPLAVYLERVEINNGNFSFNDMRQDSTKQGKDVYHLQFKDILSTLSNFTITNDTLNLEIDRMRASDPADHFNIKSFFGKLRLSQQDLSIYEFLLKTDKSQVGDSLHFAYSKPSNFSYFADSIEFYGNFQRSKIGLEELWLLNPKIPEIHEVISLSGNIHGKVGRLKGEDLDIRFGERSHLRGEASFYGLPIIKETFMDIDLKNSVIVPSDISRYLNDETKQKMNTLGVTQLDGSFMGFTSDFVARGNFYSEAGHINTDLNFKINPDKIPTYSGELAFDDFDLKALSPGSTYLGKITMNGNIEGLGFEKENANFTLQANIDSVEIRQYNYQNITTFGYFEDQIFKGKLTITDPNLAFRGDMDIDLHQDVNKIDITAKLDSIHLHKLGLTTEPLTLGSRIDIDMKGLKTDDLKGFINLYDNHIYYRHKPLQIDSIKFLSTAIGDNRIMHIETDGLTGRITGQYKNSSLFLAANNFAKELWMYSNPDSLQMNQYYKEKSATPLDSFEADITLNLWDLNRFVTPFFPDFYLSPNVRVDGTFTQNSTTILSLFTEIDTLSIQDNYLSYNEIDLNISKETYERDVLASIYVESKKQKWIDKYESQNLILDAVWYEQNMELYFNIDQNEYNNSFQINSNIEFRGSEIYGQLQPSKIKILNQPWQWAEDNHIVYKDNEWSFSNLQIHNNKESIQINGDYSYDPNKQLNIAVNQFSFVNLQSLFQTEIQGTLDGIVKIKRLEEENLIESDLSATDIMIEDFLVGNIYGVSRWENQNKRLSVDFHLIRNEDKKIGITGYILPYNSQNQLNLDAEFENTNMKILAPVFQNSVEDISGFADAKLKIKGSLGHPEIYGDGRIYDGAATITYLNTHYKVNGGVTFDKNKLQLKQVELKDNENNLAYLTGDLTFDGLKKLDLNVTGTFKNFKLLNTTAVDNNAYYGTAHGTGRIHFGGNKDNIIINASAKTNKGTRIAIPVSKASSYDIEQQEYIEFVDLTDEKVVESIENVMEREAEKIKGVQLQFDIEMTTDAYVELIFDIKSGDIIRGRGDGNIVLQINSDGDFNMFGDFEIDDGGYNFTLYNIINKEFDINKGSTIAWYGDPYEAQLNIKARYRQLASLSPLLAPYLDEEQINTPEARKKYPSIVNLKLTGDLLSPQIKFGIDIEDYPDHISIVSETNSTNQNLESIISAFKAKLASNEQEMNRQVFSLLILRKFSPENSFEVNSSSIGSSLSEFVSNQLSYWATQVDENLEIDVDLAGLDNDAFNTFQLRLSYTFLDGRLRVTRGGGLPNEETKNDMSVIIGDWTVEYLLTSDGRLRAKMYSRSDQNDINSTTGSNGIETGFSLQYVRSFDELNQILVDSRNKNRNDKPKEKSPTPQGEAIKEEDELL